MHINREGMAPQVYCRRQMELLIAKAFVKQAINAGFTISIDTGEDETRPYKRIKSVLCAMFSVDDEKLRIWKDRKRIGWVRFVYGNDGPDVINDYTTNLDEFGLMRDANAIAEKLERNEFQIVLETPS
jgi:hypothetical protein